MRQGGTFSPSLTPVTQRFIASMAHPAPISGYADGHILIVAPFCSAILTVRGDFSVCTRSGRQDYLKRKLPRESCEMELHPINFMPRSISAFMRPRARSTPGWPAAASGYR